ncbi:uncharacterized protein BN472_02703 [Tannerella sp. CAG:118]|nr:uncharacterized protein BN472_02703 [Tannerella sp. CAG:118]
MMKNHKIYFRLFFMLILSLCVSFESFGIEETGEIKWPEIKKETKPWTRWWIQGSAVTKKDITAALEAYQKAGLGGVEITPIYGVKGKEDRFIDYLSPKWMEMLVYTLNEAKRLGMGVDLANTSGWPFGGPWVDDEIACKNMRSKTFKLQGGQQLSEKIEYIEKPLAYTQNWLKVNIEDVKYPVTANEDLQKIPYAQIWYKRSLPLIVVTANKLVKGQKKIAETIDLTDKVKDGFLEWTAPPGEWLVCALFQGYHGKMVERAGPGGEGNVIDHFSELAIKRYLKKFDDAFKGYDTSYLRYYFNDSYEVDDAVESANWTPELFAEFQKICGYDLKQYIPALLGLADEETNCRVLHDYRAVISELMLEKFTKNWQSWAEKQGKGIRNQAHGSPANALDLYAASDVPETEGSTISDIKSAPSTAHLTGKNLASAESCTLLNEHFQSRLSDVKAANDKFLLGGVNHIFYHGTDFSPQDAPWPGWLFYAAVHFTPANSFWDDFGAINRYVARAQSFLQAGKPSNDILLYYGISDLWSTPGKEMFHYFHTFKTVSMDECGRYLLSKGYSWDAVSDKLLQNVKVKKDKLTAGGNTYKTIIVPKMKYMPVETFEKLIDLSKAGATVSFYGNLPSDIPGLAHLKQDRKKLESLKKRLHFTDEGDIRICRYGKGRIIVFNALPDLLEQSEVKPESLYSQGLQCIRRLKDDGNFYYFVFNPSKTKFSGWVNLNADYRTCALYNPMTGKDGYARTRVNNGKTDIWMELNPNESMIVETFQKTYSGNLYPYYKPIGGSLVLSDNWNITFVKGGPVLPEKKTVSELKSWTEYGEDYAYFSGTAEYETRLPLLSEKTDAWRLQLDNVYESAAVYINDTYLGTLFEAPYTIDIPTHLLNGNDVLKIRVSNLMANRIAYMDKKGLEWKIFYNLNIDSKGRMNVGEDGRFSAKNWDPRPSGISGNVTVTPMVLIE